MVIESDGDLRAALASIVEVAGSDLPHKFRTIHISECTEVMLQRDDRCEPLESKGQPVSSIKRGNFSSTPPAKRVSEFECLILIVLYCT